MQTLTRVWQQGYRLTKEEVFGRVDWDFLFKAQQLFRYEPEIIQKIKIVYQNMKTHFKVNGQLSQAFLIKRGLWQGCPLSIILYIILAEIF